MPLLHRTCTYPFLLVLFLLLGISPVWSQDNLYLEKPPFKRQQIQPGDSIRIQLKNQDFMMGFRLQGAHDSVIYVRGDSIGLDQIEKIWLRRPRNAAYWIKMISYAGFTAGILFPPLMVIDALTRGGLESYDARRIGIAAAGGLSIGFWFHHLRWKRIKLNGKWQLAIRTPIEDTVGGGSPSGGKQDWEGQAPLQSEQ